MEIENARITSTSITMKDHGSLTFWVFLEGCGWGVGFGGYCIGHGYLGSKDFKAENGDGLEAMMRIMDVVGVDSWEDLNGKYVRCELEGWGGKCVKIGNIITDKWFDMPTFFEERRRKNDD